MGLFRSLLITLGLVKAKVGVIVLGLANSGKTTIVSCLTNDPVEEVVPTVGFAIEKVKFENFKLTIMDMSGQMKYKELWQFHYKEAQGIVFVIDSADTARLQEANIVLQEVLSCPELKGKPLLIFCNKTDLPTALQEAELAASLNLPDDKSRAMQLQRCCALQDQGIKEGIKWLLPKLLKPKSKG